MKQLTHKILLSEVVGSDHAFGNDEGSEAYVKIKKIVDDQTFYICPVVNPDGLFNSPVDRKNHRHTENHEHIYDHGQPQMGLFGVQ